MRLFTPKADEAAVACAISRLTGENLALRMTVALLLRHSPERQAVLDDMATGAGVLSSNAHDLHPLVRVGIKETLDALRHMA